MGAISDATTYWPPLPPHRVGKRFHPILGWFKVGLGWLVNAYSNHSIHGEEWFKPTKPRESVPRMQGDRSTTEPSGIMKVAMLDFDLAWV